jgi:hypothetical protein
MAPRLKAIQSGDLYFQNDKKNGVWIEKDYVRFYQLIANFFLGTSIINVKCVGLSLVQNEIFNYGYRCFD